ncbi:MAG: nucleotidyl transferase AbiEii/AbiGii toxin family protein [Candidatus Wolfebacteria bacterium]|nr:nucleotidyl transferase AbiEii/AbiGii toxin family protein [Candidatus Wolfebacteria bacterium]
MDVNPKVTKQEADLKLDILPKETVKAFRACANMPIFSHEDWYLAGGTALALPDIAVMKIIAISQRGRKRDFFDLFWLSQNIQPLGDIILNVNRQYTVRQNLAHILKSLVYFADAENDPMPRINFNASWLSVKKFFIKEVPKITNKIIGLS